jgi:hypothetical protein
LKTRSREAHKSRVQEKLHTLGDDYTKATKNTTDNLEWCIIQQQMQQFYAAKHTMPTLKKHSFLMA